MALVHGWIGGVFALVAMYWGGDPFGMSCDIGLWANLGAWSLWMGSSIGVMLIMIGIYVAARG